MGALYLLTLLIGITCMLLLDRRFKLFFWHDPGVALLVTIVGVVLFLVWDIVGIAAGIFLRGDSAAATGIVLAPELPLEEPIFLVFLVLCTMVIYTGTARLLRGRRHRGRLESNSRGGGVSRDERA